MTIAPAAAMLRRVAGASLALLAGASTFAPTLTAQDTTAADDLVRYRIKPSSIDPSVRDFDEPHYVV
ncbi:MAG TPA: hypothetical protein VN651_14675, partial [Gemmatimonadaceae bacterium]|nr:hypothetical protein [Gemmatimonadaceae bacterium]